MNFGIVSHRVDEYQIGNLAVRVLILTVFGISIYKKVETTTNSEIVSSLIPIKRVRTKKIKSVVGFK